MSDSADHLAQALDAEALAAVAADPVIRIMLEALARWHRKRAAGARPSRACVRLSLKISLRRLGGLKKTLSPLRFNSRNDPPQHVINN